MRVPTFLAACAPVLLAGCGDAPVRQDERVAVVPGTQAAPRQQLALAAPPPSIPVPAAAPTPAPTLSVAESALINTSEMWSEPIH